MPKLFAAFGLYWHVLLDLILTHIYVIALLNAGYASISGLLMGIDSLFKATLMVFLSRFITRFPSVVRAKTSVFLRFILVGIWFVAIKQLPIDSISICMFVPFVLFKFLLTLESSLSSDFVFSLQEHFQVDLSQSMAAINILVRSGTAIAPAIALLLLTTQYISWVITAIVLMAGVLSTIYLRQVFFSPSSQHNSHAEHVPLRTLLKNPLIRWGLYFQFLGNLAFSGVAFLFLAKLKIHGDIFLNEITVLYTTFFVMQFSVLIFGDTIIPGNKIQDMIWMIAACAILVFISGLTDGHFKLFIVGAIGLVYSLILSGAQKIVVSRLRGKGFIEYSTWAQLIGRITSFGSIAVLGFGINVGISSSALLMVCGTVGIISCFMLAKILP